MGVLYPFLPFFLLTFACQEINGIELYIHIRGAFSVARFDKQGNAKASTRGTSNRTGSTFFVFVCKRLSFINRQEGAIGIKNI